MYHIGSVTCHENIMSHQLQFLSDNVTIFSLNWNSVFWPWSYAPLMFPLSGSSTGQYGWLPDIRQQEVCKSWHKDAWTDTSSVQSHEGFDAIYRRRRCGFQWIHGKYIHRSFSAQWSRLAACGHHSITVTSVISQVLDMVTELFFSKTSIMTFSTWQGLYRSVGWISDQHYCIQTWFPMQI